MRWLWIVIVAGCGGTAKPALQAWHACWLPGYALAPAAGREPYEVVLGPASTGVLALDATWDRHVFRSEYIAGLVALELPTDAPIGQAIAFGAAHPLHYVEGSVGGFNDTHFSGAAIVRAADDHSFVVELHGTREDGPGPPVVNARVTARRCARP